jgi:hypothetical protein
MRSVLTIAASKPVYFTMAVNLARSFCLWNELPSIGFFIATDLGSDLPPDLQNVELIRFDPGSLGSGFATKLHLDRLAPTKETLFIDADCICLGSLESVFERFQGHSVSAIGGTISEGEWFGDVADICARFSVCALPKFNGGVYYVERGPKASAVYDRARSLEQDYDRFGLIRLRGRPNDELLVAIAMAIEGCATIPEDGTILGDLFSCPDAVTIDVLTGQGLLRNPPAPDPRHQQWFALQETKPRIVHFLGHHVEGWRYRTEALKLVLVSRLKLPSQLARPLASLYAAPFRLAEKLKDYLRPGFHRYIGPRKLKPGVR